MARNSAKHSLKTVGYVSGLEAEVDRKHKQVKKSGIKPKATKPSNYVPKPCLRFQTGASATLEQPAGIPISLPNFSYHALHYLPVAACVL